MQKVSIKAFLIWLGAVILTFSFSNCAYAQQTTSTSPLRPIQQNGKWGYIDSTGKIVIKPQFVWAEEFSEGLAAIENEDGKHGYIDESGRVVIEPKFDNWTDFSEGLAAVSGGGRKARLHAVDEEDARASREPRVRGRAPIFEPGQRSIASLMDDIVR